MADVRVGMRLLDPHCPQQGLCTVTALTPRGFTYDAEYGYSLGARHGVVRREGHEHFGHDGECLLDLVILPTTQPKEQP